MVGRKLTKEEHQRDREGELQTYPKGNGSRIGGGISHRTGQGVTGGEDRGEPKEDVSALPKADVK